LEYVTDSRLPHLGGNIAGGDYRSWVPEVWDYLLNSFRINSVYDVGCGVGRELSWFTDDWSVGNAIGLDGLASNVEQASKFAPTILHDLTLGPMPIHGIDLVWCSEVAEHVEERFVDHLLDTICCGRFLALTAALPGEGGWHHVNLRPPEYWIEKIEARGLAFLPAETDHSRQLAPTESFWKTKGLLFQRS
jgi:SAM-dependent methyltransferase